MLTKLVCVHYTANIYSTSRSALHIINNTYIIKFPVHLSSSSWTNWDNLFDCEARILSSSSSHERPVCLIGPPHPLNGVLNACDDIVQQTTHDDNAAGTPCTNDTQCHSGSKGLYCSPFKSICQTGEQICLSFTLSPPGKSDISKGSCGSSKVFSDLGAACANCFQAGGCGDQKCSRCSAITLEQGGYAVYIAPGGDDKITVPGYALGGAVCTTKS